MLTEEIKTTEILKELEKVEAILNLLNTEKVSVFFHPTTRQGKYFCNYYVDVVGDLKNRIYGYFRTEALKLKRDLKKSLDIEEEYNE